MDYADAELNREARLWLRNDLGDCGILVETCHLLGRTIPLAGTDDGESVWMDWGIFLLHVVGNKLRA